jgi:hypothetical protein
MPPATRNGFFTDPQYGERMFGYGLVGGLEAMR